MLHCDVRRSIRWLDRCIEAHKQTDKQNLFAIVQGGLNAQLRTRCANGQSQQLLSLQIAYSWNDLSFICKISYLSGCIFLSYVLFLARESMTCC